MSMSLYFRNDNAQTIHFDDGSTGTLAGDMIEVIGGDLNMSNANAFAFVRLLGISPDAETGEIDSQPVSEFLKALRDALALIETGPQINVNFDAGREARTYAGRGATIIDCGRPDGYFEPRIRTAIQMAEDAIRKGATHAYFC